MAIEETMLVYDYAREGYLDGTLDYDGDTIELWAVGSGYSPSSSADLYGNDITPTDVIAVADAPLSSKTKASGVAKADDSVFTNPPAGEIVVGFVGVDTTVDVADDGRLIFYIGKDSNGDYISIDTDDGDIRVRFGAGTDKIFRL